MVNVLIAGEGARENSIGFALQKDARVDHVYIAPGNGGTSLIPKCVPAFEYNTVDKIVGLAVKKNVKQVWVGPEGLLSQDIVRKSEEMGVDCVIGAPKDCMRLEGSKCWQKDLMKQAGVPIARHRNFHYPDDVNLAFEYVNKMYDNGVDLVVKYDTYAKGKGSIVCSSRDEALWAVQTLMIDRRIGDLQLDPSNGNVEIDERLDVIAEESFFVLKNEKTMTTFGTACEDKKAYDENSSDLNFFRKFRNKYYTSFYKNGPTSRNIENIFPLTMNPNTGGMIGVAQSPYANEESIREIMNTIVEPTFRAYKIAAGYEWRGIAYFGLLLVRDGDKITRKVSEFNARDGDTEMELRMPLLETSLYEIGNAYVEDRLDGMEIKWRDSWTFGLALVSGRLSREFCGDYSDLEDVANDSIGFVKDQNLGYPWPHVTNQPITGLDQVKKAHVFGAGIAVDNQRGEVNRNVRKLEFSTSGGRTMVLVGEGDTIDEAERVVYDEQEKIFYANKRIRKTHVDWSKPLSTF